MNKWVSLSYPRSGATFIRYCAKTMLNLPLYTGHHDDYLDNTQYIKMHYPPQHMPSHKINGLILCIRDYKECMIRHYNDRLDQLDLKENFITGSTSYYGNIKYYDKSTRPKIIIYYEDLIQHPEIEIKKLGDFLGVDSSDFISNLDYHKEQSLNEYQKNIDPSFTKGKYISFHRYLFSPQKLRDMDHYAYDYNPKLYKKYLSRYWNEGLLIKE